MSFLLPNSDGLSSPSKRIPLINLENIGLRPEPVVPDGVWIEVQGNGSANEAVVNAINEEKRIRDMLDRKSERLRQFQDRVQKRVTYATQAQKKLLTESQNFKMEKERELLLRSASAAELSTPKKNRCSYNVNPLTVIDGTGKLSTSLNLSTQDQGDPMLHISDDLCSNCLVNDARKKLARRTIVPRTSDVSDQFAAASNQLPGGLWGVGASRDKCMSRIYNSDGRVDCEEESKDKDSSLETVSATSASDDVTLASLQESIASSLAVNQKRLHEISKSCSFLKQDLDEESEPRSEPLPLKANVHFELPDYAAENKNSPILITAAEKEKVPEVVSSSLPSNAKRLDPRRRVTRHNRVGDVRRADTSTRGGMNENDYLQQRRSVGAPPLVNPGVLAHNLKMADERAKWLSRRVFADAERERSREHARWKDHQQRVAKLREEKERERAEIEEKSREQVEAVERANELMKIAVEKREKREKQRRASLFKKQQKTERYVTALYSQLRERIAKHKIELPPLCMCGTSFWDTNPNTCATNCLFYRNPKAYTKALQAVLAAVERNMGPLHKDLLQKSTVSLGLVDEDPEDSDLCSARTASARSQKSIDLSACSDILKRFSDLSSGSW